MARCAYEIAHVPRLQLLSLLIRRLRCKCFLKASRRKLLRDRVGRLEVAVALQRRLQRSNASKRKLTNIELRRVGLRSSDLSFDHEPVLVELTCAVLTTRPGSSTSLVKQRWYRSKRTLRSISLNQTFSAVRLGSLFILMKASSRRCATALASSVELLCRQLSQSVLADDFTAPSKDRSILKKRASACNNGRSCKGRSLMAVLMKPYSLLWPVVLSLLVAGRASLAANVVRMSIHSAPCRRQSRISFANCALKTDQAAADFAWSAEDKSFGIARRSPISLAYLTASLCSRRAYDSRLVWAEMVKNVRPMQSLVS